jgi:hypothetical protein
MQLPRMLFFLHHRYQKIELFPHSLVVKVFVFEGPFWLPLPHVVAKPSASFPSLHNN